MKACPILAACLVACASGAPLRGDWCGTEHAEIRYAGELASDCAEGDSFACQLSIHECATGRAFFCRSDEPASPSEVLLAECVAHEVRDGALCASPDYPVMHPARHASRCDRYEHADCYKLGLVREHTGDLEAATRLYAQACDHGIQAACLRTKALSLAPRGGIGQNESVSRPSN